MWSTVVKRLNREILNIHYFSSLVFIPSLNSHDYFVTVFYLLGAVFILLEVYRFFFFFVVLRRLMCTYRFIFKLLHLVINSHFRHFVRRDKKQMCRRREKNEKGKHAIN